MKTTMFNDLFMDTFLIQNKVNYSSKADVNNYYLDLECPGFDISELSLSAEEGLLKIAGKQQVNGAPVKTLKQTFTMDKDSNLESISAKYVNGILSIVIPRIAPVHVEVRSVPITGT